MVAEGNLGIISMWKTFKLYMLSASSMLNRMRETIKYQAQTVLGKYNLVKVIYTCQLFLRCRREIFILGVLPL